MDARSSARISRESNPDRAKMMTTTTRRSMQLQPLVKAVAAGTRTVQVVYYLSRNGQLEHPHFMELHVHRELRLRDFMERLTALRGKGMPALYSWSSKRSYKNGYVWNDLAENDVIFPSDGADYVLKGSELLGGCAERLIQEQLQIPPTSGRLVAQPKRTLLPSPTPATIPTQLGQATNNYEYQHFSPEEEDEDEHEEAQEVVLEMEDEEKTSYTSSTTSRCSRGVSTDHELLLLPNHTATTCTATDINSSTSPKITNNSKKGNSSSAPTSMRFEDGDPIQQGARGNSVLLQLISCGNLALTTRAKNTAPPMSTIGNDNNNNNVVGIRKSSGCDGSNYYSDSLRKGVLYKAATAGGNSNRIHGEVINGNNNKVVVGRVREEEEMSMIRYMSENPRFGNLQGEDKEYFSGSIVESMISEDRVVVARDPVETLKRSNSYGELDRSSKAGLDEEEAANEEENIKDRAALKGKCIPRNICSLTSKPTLRK